MEKDPRVEAAREAGRRAVAFGRWLFERQPAWSGQTAARSTVEELADATAAAREYAARRNAHLRKARN